MSEDLSYLSIVVWALSATNILYMFTLQLGSCMTLAPVKVWWDQLYTPTSTVFIRLPKVTGQLTKSLIYPPKR